MIPWMLLQEFFGYSLSELIILFILLIIGLAIIIFIVKLIFIFLPAAIIGFVVWWFSGSLFWAGIAFLLVALVSIVRR